MHHGRTAGQAVVEYALALVLILLVVILALRLMGVSLNAVYCQVVGIFNKNACAGVLCEDRFANLSGEQVPFGAWSAANGQACIQGGGVMYNQCSTTRMSASDYQVTMSNALLTSGNGYGVYFRATNSPAGLNGYAFQYDPGANGFVIRKWVNGVEIFSPTLAQVSNPGYSWYGQAHNLSVKVVGSTFTGYVDGVAVITAQDSTFTSGGTGIRTWDSTVLCTSGLSVNSP